MNDVHESHCLVVLNARRNTLQYGTSAAFYGHSFGRDSKTVNNLNIQQRFSASVDKECRCSMEGRREVHDDANWRLISIETPLLHIRLCHTDDLPDVILRLLRNVQR
jgi:hypothetical protein